MKKIISIIALVLVLLGVFALLKVNNSQSEKIKIGVVGPFSGASAAFGEYIDQGIKVALEALPESERNNIQIIKEDDMCNGKDAISAVRKLIEIEKIKYIIGPMCNESSLATEQLIEDNKVISLSVGLPSNKIANMGLYHFTLAPEIENLMKALAQEMVKKDLRHVAIIHMSVAFEDENYKHFVKYFTEFGGVIVADEAKPKGSTDFRDAVLKVKQAKPDSLMLIAHTGDLNNILKQVSTQGLINLPKFGIHAAETPILLQEKTLAEGLIYPYPADSSSNNVISKGYPVSKIITIDSLGALIKSINKCGYENKECVQNYLSNLKDYPGVNGILSVDTRGVGTYKEIMLKVVKNGEFVKLEVND